MDESKQLSDNFNKEIKEASDQTRAINQAFYDRLDFSDKKEADFASRNWIAGPQRLELWDEDQTKIVWSQAAFGFLKDYQKSPPSVNPSLWRSTENNHLYGLFKVADGIYQVRGYDFSNLTVVATDNGWIVLDPLISTECAKAAMKLVSDHLGIKPIKAIIYSHSHGDHYGGIKGLIDDDDLADAGLSFEDQMASGKIPVIGPEGFTKSAASAKKWVEYMGDIEVILKKAKADFDAGQYQWVAEITNVIVFGDPSNWEARYLCADAMEQLGYQAESGVWRNVYLTGAYELRNGAVKNSKNELTVSPDMAMNLNSEMMLDYMGILLNGETAGEMNYRVNLNLIDTKEVYALRIYGGVILYYANSSDPNPDLTITTAKNALFYIINKDKEGIEKTMKLQGDRSIIDKLMDNMIDFNQRPFFNIIEP